MSVTAQTEDNMRVTVQTETECYCTNYECEDNMSVTVQKLRII